MGLAATRAATAHPHTPRAAALETLMPDAAENHAAVASPHQARAACVLPDDDPAVVQYLKAGRATLCPTGVAAATTAALDPADLQRLADRTQPRAKRQHSAWGSVRPVWQVEQ